MCLTRPTRLLATSLLLPVSLRVPSCQASRHVWPQGGCGQRGWIQHRLRARVGHHGAQAAADRALPPCRCRRRCFALLDLLPLRLLPWVAAARHALGRSRAAVGCYGSCSAVPQPPSVAMADGRQHLCWRRLYLQGRRHACRRQLPLSQGLQLMRCRQRCDGLLNREVHLRGQAWRRWHRRWPPRRWVVLLRSCGLASWHRRAGAKASAVFRSRGGAGLDHGVPHHQPAAGGELQAFEEVEGRAGSCRHERGCIK
jgi:hypothetical protein